MRVHHALAISNSDRSAPFEARQAADARRRVQNLYDAASRLRADSFESESQPNSDPESAKMASSWSKKNSRPVAVAMSESPPRETLNDTRPGGPMISFWA